MNKDRRHAISLLSKELVAISNSLERALWQEQTSLDNIPDNFSESDRYYDMENNIDILENVVDELREIAERLGEI